MIQIHYINDGRYCSSRELHKVLKLNPAHYARDVKKWLTSEYLFQGKKQLTKPVANYDYRQVIAASSNSPSVVSGDNQLVKFPVKGGNFASEFMIRLELVKLITLHGSRPHSEVLQPNRAGV